MCSAGFRHEVAPLPFELRVLETCIGDICHLCTQLTKELEGFANPALDDLTRAVRAQRNGVCKPLCVRDDCGCHSVCVCECDPVLWVCFVQFCMLLLVCMIDSAA